MRVIPAPREKLFRAWTRPELLTSWFAPPGLRVIRAEVDLRVGGLYVIETEHPDGTSHTTHGRYLEIADDERLVYTWTCDLFGAHETCVTVTFRDVDGGTEINLAHEHFPSSDERDQHRHGWEGCFASLEAKVETL